MIFFEVSDGGGGFNYLNTSSPTWRGLRLIRDYALQTARFMFIPRAALFFPEHRRIPVNTDNLVTFERRSDRPPTTNRVSLESVKLAAPTRADRSSFSSESANRGQRDLRFALLMNRETRLNKPSS